MANNIIKRVWNQGSMTPIEDLQGSAFTNENGGHTFQISGVDSNGEALALSGTVAASFLRPDQTTVGISGSVSGGVASVTLSEECYGIPGRFGLVIFMTSDGKKTAIYSCVGNVARSSTDTVAPGVVADVVDLINEIEAAVDTIPTSYSALMADIAPTYSSSALYAVGDYAWYEGDLKRCIVPITVGETYTPAHWTSAVVGDDVCALKSAINNITDQENISSAVIDTSGSSAAVNYRFIANKAPVPSGCTITQVCFIPNNGSGATKGKLEFATKSGDTYTVYKSVAFNFTSPTVSELVNFLPESVKAVGDTYVFICLDSDSSGKVRNNVSAGKKNQYTSDVSSSSFTLTNATTGTEIAYKVYYVAVIGQTDANERINALETATSDIATIRSNASKVNNYPFSPDATLKVNTTDFSGLKNAIKDIRLFCADINETYWIYTYLVNYSGSWKVEIKRESDGVIVCGFSANSAENAFKTYRLNDLTNSGITGYIVWNPYAFTTSYYFAQSSYTKISQICISERSEYDMKYLIENVMCIGDSLTQGYIKPTGESYYHTKDSYPSILKKICNAENVLNRGASGFAASNYYSQNIVGHPSWYPFADYDYVIVWLGTNAGLDTEEQQTAYDNIISAIQTGNANAKIFLCTCFTTTGTSLSDTNAYIRSKNLPVIDINIAPFNLSSDSNMHPYDQTHFGDVGYQMVAEHIVSEIEKYIETHMSAFNRIGRPIT